MGIMMALGIVLALMLIAWLGAGVAGLETVFGVVIPAVAIAVFLIGMAAKIIGWARSPVPFRIPLTGGQQVSVEGMKPNKFDAPPSRGWTVVRMALEVLLFRSLFRNTKAEQREDQQLVYSQNIALWVAGLAFHYAFLIVFLRHFRFFLDPVPQPILWLQQIDGFFEFALPTIFITDFLLVGAVTYLFLRRVVIPQVKYVSLLNDYFPLLLILAIAGTGLAMRHIWKVDLTAVKATVAGLFSFSPASPAGIGTIFYIHLFLVCCLLLYFPFSKLVHMGGVFMSPTRNMANNSRVQRHINPWNPEVDVHSYEHWEEEFHDLIKGAGLPLDKE